MTKLLLFALSSALGLAQMPYQVGWVYTTSSLNSTSMTLYATTIAETNGVSGHTASAVVKLISSDGRVSYGTSGWSYSSQANGSISLCSGNCYDGLYQVESSGSEEYCPIAATYITSNVSYADNPISPYVYVSGAAWSFPAIPKQNGSSTFTVNVGKSNSCQASNAEVQANFFIPSGMQSILAPATNPQTASFSGFTASASWVLTTSGNNAINGKVPSDGLINSASCVLIGTVKSAELTVNP